MDVTMVIGIRRLWRQRNARKIHTCKRYYSADIQEIPHFIPNYADEGGVMRNLPLISRVLTKMCLVLKWVYTKKCKMDKKSKVILGLRSRGSFTTGERHQIIKELLSSRCSKREIWEKYTGQVEEHGNLLKWMRQLGYTTALSSRRFIFGGNISLMTKKKSTLVMSEESFEVLQLKKRISELENQLKDAEMKALAFSTMVDIAEKEFNIQIRKKLNTKPLKK
jgi:transposase